MPPSTPPRSIRSSMEVFSTPSSHFQAMVDSPARASSSTEILEGTEMDVDIDAELAALDALTDDDFDESDEHDRLHDLERAGSGSGSAGSTPGARREEEMEEEPLVGRRWREEGKEGLLSLIPPLILSHGLPMLPLLGMLPYNFLPAGVVFFIPALCILVALSACAHIVVVYLAWYLKVPSFEEVFYVVVGRRQWGLHVGRGAVMVSVMGLLVSWLETFHPLLEPLLRTHLRGAFWHARLTWTILPALMLLPVLMPSRTTRNMRAVPIALALLLPVVVFVIIGRTVEIQKQQDLDKRAFGIGSSAGAGITALTIFASPHVNTLAIHATLDRNKRSSFAFPCLISSGTLLILAIPLALVPYYILPPLTEPTATPTSSSGVFARLPADDGWVNAARVAMMLVSLGTCAQWLMRARDTMLRAMGVDSGERDKAGKWVGLGIWAIVLLFACIGGVVAEKIELLGVLATIAVSWFLPSLFFIITFHVRSPLSIVFPGKHAPTESQINQRANDPSADILLMRKERQLQKQRVGRRLWQDLIVYLGILPVGGATILWTSGSFIGLW